MSQLAPWKLFLNWQVDELTKNDPDDDGVAEDGDDEDEGEHEGPGHLAQRPHVSAEYGKSLNGQAIIAWFTSLGAYKCHLMML